MPRQFRTGDYTLVRELNRSIILNQLWAHPRSRADLSVITGLNKTTVSSLASELIVYGFVREINPNASAGGRPAVPLEINPAAGCIIGLEIGVGYLNVALTDFCAGLLWKRQIPTDESDEQHQIINRAARLVHQALKRVERTGIRLLGIGITVPGLVDSASGMVIYAPNLDWRDVPLGQIFSRKFDAPILVDNDANAAALAERYLGVAQAANKCVYVVANLGIGVGLVLDGQIYHGATGYAGEAGHVTLDPEGPPCHCGNRGCWERFASQTALLERLNGTNQNVSSAESPSHASLQAVLEAARHGDAAAQAALEKTGEYLGIGIANLINTFNPDLVVLGGLLSQAEEFLLPVIQQTVARRAISGPREVAQLVISEYKSDACVMGGVAIVIHDILCQPKFESTPSLGQSQVFSTQVPKKIDRSSQRLTDHSRSLSVIQNRQNQQPNVR